MAVCRQRCRGGNGTIKNGIINKGIHVNGRLLVEMI